MIPSTINKAVLDTLPSYSAPANRRLGTPGMGCFLDAPGYPSYFVQPVYTPCGNSPETGPEVVLFGRVIETADWKTGETWESRQAEKERLFMSLWNPPAYESARVQEWVNHVYRHFAHCYRDAERPEYGKPGTLIYPIPGYKLESECRQKFDSVDGRKVARYSEKYIRAKNEKASAFNRVEIARAEKIATPDNHLAVLTIRKFYPGHQPRTDYILSPPRLNQADWWETEDEQPTPETCKPKPGSVHKAHNAGGYCRWCGYGAKVEA